MTRRPNGTPILFLTSGLPGAGKSTIAERLRNEQDVVWVRRDDYRNRFGGYSRQKEVYVRMAVEADTKGYLLDGKDVVVDAVLHQTFQRGRVAAWASDLWDHTGWSFCRSCIYLPCDLEVSRERRINTIPEEMHDKFYAEFSVPTIEEGFHVYVVDAMMVNTDVLMHRQFRPLRRLDLRC